MKQTPDDPRSNAPLGPTAAGSGSDEHAPASALWSKYGAGAVMMLLVASLVTTGCSAKSATGQASGASTANSAQAGAPPAGSQPPTGTPPAGGRPDGSQPPTGTPPSGPPPTGASSPQ